MVALIAQDIIPERRVSPCSNNLVASLDTTLIVAPSKSLDLWIAAIEQHTKLSYYCYHGASRRKGEAKRQRYYLRGSSLHVMSTRKFNFDCDVASFSEYDIILTTPKMLSSEDYWLRSTDEEEKCTFGPEPGEWLTKKPKLGIYGVMYLLSTLQQLTQYM